MITPQYPEIVKHFSAAGIRTVGKLKRMIESLDPEEAGALLCDWDLWSLPYQRMPEGSWRRWSFRAGRGTGKTHTGARTVSEVARDRQKIKTGTIGQVREGATTATRRGRVQRTRPSDLTPAKATGHRSARLDVAQRNS